MKGEGVNFFNLRILRETITKRNPNTLRPWQHVLVTLSGYLKLAEKIFMNNKDLTTSFNFGPSKDSNKTLLNLIKTTKIFLPFSLKIIDEKNGFHETSFLGLNIMKVKEKIGWKPRCNFVKTV